MTSFPAQPDNTPDALMLDLLAKNTETLGRAFLVLMTEKPKRAVKDQLRRDLRGVIGDLETICQGLS